jgi:hypothetical protein
MRAMLCLAVLAALTSLCAACDFTGLDDVTPYVKPTDSGACSCDGAACPDASPCR